MINLTNHFIGNPSSDRSTLAGFTLVELIISLSIIALLAAVTVTQMAATKRIKLIVDNTTEIIINQLNQANAKSISTNTSNQTATVCHVAAGVGNNRADCDNTQSTWRNINGITFNNKCVVNLFDHPAGNNIITYVNGYINAGDSTKPAFVMKVIGSGPDPGCKTANNNIPINQINIWKNGVIDVEQTC